MTLWYRFLCVLGKHHANQWFVTTEHLILTYYQVCDICGKKFNTRIIEDQPYQ